MTNLTERRQFIEASAGTGKTYRIVQTVVELVASGTRLENILIVTYTEKATGELRRRIREGLENQWRSNGDEKFKATIRTALDAMDDAPIYTIHGFCQRMLQEYAFETGQAFRLQLLDDPRIWDRLFANSLRGVWRRNLLDYSRDTARCEIAYQKNFYRDAVMEVSRRFMRGDTLFPKGDLAPVSLRATIGELSAILQSRLGTSPDDSPLLESIQNAKMHAGTKKAIKNKIADLIALFVAHEAGELSALQRETLFTWNLTDSGWKALEPLKESGEISGAEVSALESVKSLAADSKAALLACAVADLSGSYARFKQTAGFFDFNDMLLHLRDALSLSELMRGVLRERFQCVLVDEFQDTDQVQWEIFKTAFLESEPHRLIVVGDPKQAIYSFRGANVRAYLGARDSFGNGAQISLATNYRSHGPLLNALNTLFQSESGWFSAEVGGIEYQPVQPPSEETRRARLYADESGRAPLSLVGLPEDATGGQCRRAFGHFVADEIRHLLQSKIEIAHKSGAQLQKRSLNAGDICLLIRTRTELPALANVLRKARIPFGFARDMGIFESQQALEWRYLLRAVAAPDDLQAVMKALLSSFFHCRSEDVENFAALPDFHPLRQMLARWNALSVKREWHQMLRSILEDSGVLLRAMSGEQGDRIVTNHQHIAQLLLEQAIRAGGSLDDLIAYLDAEYSRGNEGEKLQRLETEEPRVQIMTMHSAKGLEFPVVFIAGGFTYADKARDYRSFTTEEGRFYSFGDDEKSKKQSQDEEQDELRRLFYVALTRAQYKLYLPDLPAIKHSPGPLATFIKTAIGKLREPSQQRAGVGEISIDLHGNATSSAVEIALDGGSEIQSAQAGSTPGLREANPLRKVASSWGKRQTRMTSFSRITAQHKPETARRTYQVPNEENYPNAAERMEDEVVAVGDDAASANENSNALPPGTATGTLLHEVLEKIKYSAVLSAETPDALLENEHSRGLIEAKIKQHLPRRATSFAENFEGDKLQVATLVWRALRTPMPFLDGAPLATLGECRHEMEFLLPARGLSAEHIPGVQLQYTYLKGIIDLVFRHNGRYFILDWKSNWQRSGDYSQFALTEMMTASRYDLQYKIYTLALDRILRVSQKNYDPAANLGGVCYLFLRGLSENGGDKGIYFVSAEKFDLPRWEQEIFGQLNSASGGQRA